jgi:hypothetical protein
MTGTVTDMIMFNTAKTTRVTTSDTSLGKKLLQSHPAP